MSRSRDWKRHPAVFCDILADLYRTRGTPPIELKVETMGQARSVRLDFNSFKIGCIDAGFVEACPPWEADRTCSGYYFLDQIEVLVRDEPPRIIIGLKDNSEIAKLLDKGMEERAKALRGDENE